MPVAGQDSERLSNLPNGKHSTQMEPNQNTTVGRSALAEIGLSTINPNNTITVAPLEAVVRPQGIPSITQAPTIPNQPALSNSSPLHGSRPATLQVDRPLKERLAQSDIDVSNVDGDSPSTEKTLEHLLAQSYCPPNFSESTTARDKPCLKTSRPVTPGLEPIHKAMDRLNEYRSLALSSPMASAELASHDSRYFIERLFPENQLICSGDSFRRFGTRSRNETYKDLQDLAYIVPAYMKAVSGLTATNMPELGKIPHLSSRSNANTGDFRFVVYRRTGAGLNDQARNVIRLAQRSRLVMIVRNTPRQIEAWYSVIGWEHMEIEYLQNAAIRLGASRKMKINCGYYALPQGLKWGREPQDVVYFDPSALQP